MLKLKTGLRRFARLCIDATQIDNQATVVEAIEPGRTGRVQFQATSWLARCPSGAALQPGQTVYVIDRRNTTLFVELTSVPIDLNTMSVFWAWL